MLTCTITLIPVLSSYNFYTLQNIANNLIATFRGYALTTPHSWLILLYVYYNFF